MVSLTSIRNKFWPMFKTGTKRRKLSTVSDSKKRSALLISLESVKKRLKRQKMRLIESKLNRKQQRKLKQLKMSLRMVARMHQLLNHHRQPHPQTQQQLLTFLLVALKRI